MRYSAILALAAAGILPGSVPAQQKPAKAGVGSDAFGLTKVWQFNIEITAKDWDRMQPIGGMKFGPGGFGPKKGPEKPPEKPADKPTDVHKGNGFGTEYPWVNAQFTADGKTYKNVGLRFKGNASYMASARGLKRNFRIDLDHYDEDLRFHGLKSINLNAGAMDPTRGREVLSYAVFRAAGVPASRTAFVEVTLTMPDKYDKEYLGLYTFVEHVDKSFLKDHFKNGKGLLMKPEKMPGIQYLGDDWERYKTKYNPKHELKKKEAQRVIDFARLVNIADDETFNKHIGTYLDIDGFLRFAAANAMLVNLDSFFTLGHNYYIYLNPETNKFVFFPWDLDLSLGGFPMAGSSEQQMDLSLIHPYPGQNKLTDRLLAIKEIREKYQKVLKDLSATCFTKEKLLKDVDAIESVTKERLVKEKKAAEARKEGGFGFGPGGKGPFGQPVSLRTFVEKRTASIEAQLAGTSKGYVPVMGFGPGGKGGPFGKGFGPGMFLARPVMKGADTDKDGKVSKDEFLDAAKRFFKECDKDNKGALDFKTLADGIQRLMAPPPGFGPPPPPPGGGPGNPVAGAIFLRTRTDKDGKLALADFLKAAEALFAECDKDKNGSLNEKEIVAGINLFFPPPPGFGPPGFGPPPPGGPDGPRPFDQPKKKEGQP